MRARHLQLLAGITLAGALLRFTTLDVQSYWLDEVATVNLLHKGFGAMLSGVASGESTPPLYYIVAWVWAKLFGTGEVGLRSLSALLGTATIPLAYSLARRVASRRAGLLAAALAAFNPLLVWYSQEARSYALMILLTGATLVVFVRVLEAPTARRLVVWVLLGVASLATHYYAGFLLGAEALWLLWRIPRRAIPAVGAIVVAAAALLPLALHQKSTGNAGFISTAPFARRLVQIPKQFAVGYHGPAEVVLTVVTLALAAYGLARLLTFARGPARGAPRAGLGSAARSTARSMPLGPPGPAARPGLDGILLAGIAIVAIAAAFVLSVVGPDYLIARNVIASLLPLLVAVAAGLAIARFGLGAASVICAIGLLIVISVDTNERYQRDNWRGAAEFIGKVDQPRVVIVTPASGRVPLLHYLRGARPTPAAGAAVKEVVFVGMAARGPGEAPKPPRPPQVPLANFTEVRRQQADTYTVVVEQSANAAPIQPQVGASSLDGQPALTIYQP